MNVGVRAELERVFAAARAAVDPAVVVRRQVVRRDDGIEIAGERIAAGGRLAVLAVGKAALPMARALASELDDAISELLVVAPDGEPADLPRGRVRLAAHPVPDARSEAAGREALHFVQSRANDEVLVVLLSGGASSLLTCPAPGLALADLAQTTELLLRSGLPIEAQNAVRGQVSAVAGGRLARATSADRVIVLVISDVLGDRLDVIGSGPFAAEATTRAEAAELLRAQGLWDRVPAPVRDHLVARDDADPGSSSRRASPTQASVRHVVIANNRTALDAAVAASRAGGRPARIVTDELRGEARRAGCRLAALASATRLEGSTLLLAGGETTVTVTGAGQGGRSQELALAAALALDGTRHVGLLAAGTDGRDGPTDAAGAFVDGGTVVRGAARGVDARARLADNDAYGFFAAEGGLLRTGPTGTNVMDLVLIACEPAAP